MRLPGHVLLGGGVWNLTDMQKPILGLMSETLSGQPAVNLDSKSFSTPPETNFGQEYSLLTALNKLVRDYSLGIGLFKEFIQILRPVEAIRMHMHPKASAHRGKL